MYVLVLLKNVVKFFFSLFVCEVIGPLSVLGYMEFNQKINGNGFIAMTSILNEKLNTASMINTGIIKFLDGIKYYDGRSKIIFQGHYSYVI